MIKLTFDFSFFSINLYHLRTIFPTFFFMKPSSKIKKVSTSFWQVFTKINPFCLHDSQNSIKHIFIYFISLTFCSGDSNVASKGLFPSFFSCLNLASKVLKRLVFLPDASLILDLLSSKPSLQQSQHFQFHKLAHKLFKFHFHFKTVFFHQVFNLVQLDVCFFPP